MFYRWRVAMQSKISDRAAITFAGEFYDALADGLPVDASVAEGRKAIYNDWGGFEWATPVLHLRAKNGELFEVEKEAVQKPEKPKPNKSRIERKCRLSG